MTGVRPQDGTAAGRAERSGLVICGGHSRRMGTDKALVDLAGARFLDRSIAALAPLVGEVVLATGSEPRYPELGLRTVTDVRPDCGPLAGLVAGLEEARAADRDLVLVLACDTPRADARLFEALLARLDEAGSADACLLRTPDGLEPLCAVYRTTCAAPALAALAGGRRRMTSFHDEVELAYLELDELPADLVAARPDTNVNTPAELESERAWFAGGGSGSSVERGGREVCA